MANPQIENGHIDIANEIAEAFAYNRISGEEWQVLWVILRKTWGWHKKDDAIALSQFNLLTKMIKPRISRTLKKLLSKKIINVTKGDNKSLPNTYSFNKNYDEWVLPKRAIIKKDNGVVIKKDTYKRKSITKEKDIRKEIYKESFGEFKNILLNDEELKKLQTRFPDFQDRIERLSEYLAQTGHRYKSHYATILSWSRKDKKDTGPGVPEV